MSPTLSPPGSEWPVSINICVPRGPTKSPHALSRGKTALSNSATRAPWRASVSAAKLPAGPDPTISTSKRTVVRELSADERGISSHHDTGCKPIRREQVGRRGADRRLRSRVEVLLEGSPAATRTQSPLADDDLQLALYLCYQVHHRELSGADADRKQDPALLGIQARLERVYLRPW